MWFRWCFLWASWLDWFVLSVYSVVFVWVRFCSYRVYKFWGDWAIFWGFFLRLWVVVSNCRSFPCVFLQHLLFFGWVGCKVIETCFCSTKIHWISLRRLIKFGLTDLIRVDLIVSRDDWWFIGIGLKIIDRRGAGRLLGRRPCRGRSRGWQDCHSCLSTTPWNC